MGGLPGYIAIGGLSWIDGYCEGQPDFVDNLGNGRPSKLFSIVTFFEALIPCLYTDCQLYVIYLACSKTLVESFGFILSPQHPGFYAPKSHCTWLITAPDRHVVRLEVIDLQLEHDPRCATDYLEIIDGNNFQEQRLGKFCGEEIPALIESRSNTVMITFRSDTDIQGNGFKLHYSFRGKFILTRISYFSLGLNSLST